MAVSDQYITTRQGAKLASVNILTIRRWFASGRLAGERVGEVTLIERASLERVITERRAFGAGR